MSKKKMNILAIGSHPDDIEIGCGGALAKYAEKGNNIYMLVLTRGGKGGESEIRQKEQVASQKILGAKKLFWGDYMDTQLTMSKELIGKIEATIAEVEPDFIFCPYYDDTHQDHRHLAQATISATRYIRNVLHYEGPTTMNFNPHVFVNIADTLEIKMAALKAHTSQIGKTNIKDLTILELAHSNANFRGIQGRVKYAEAFYAVRLFINMNHEKL